MTSSITLSPGQEQAVKAVRAWLRDPNRKQIFRLFGYAGTGKTTCAKLMAEEVLNGAAYCALSGKAALQMRKAGCKRASTIHSLIYKVDEDDHGRVKFKFDPDGRAADVGLIVVDECSMVGDDIKKDLMRYRKPILVLGDPAQLPPVKDGGALTDADPDVMLTEIHRQAADNPIIRLATDAREGRQIDVCDLGRARVVQTGTLSASEVIAADQVLCGTHRKRRAYNARIRRTLGLESSLPENGDRVICLRNDKSKGIFNGGLYTVEDNPRASSTLVRMDLASQDFPDRAPVDVEVRREFFEGDPSKFHRSELRGTQQFDFGYAITVHKAQGSQWDNVIVYDESGVFREAGSRWLYTAITRAAERLTVVV